MKSSFPNLFRSLSIRDLELKNRIAMPPMHTALGSETGMITDRIIQYYARRAKGGVGLIEFEATSIDTKLGKSSPHTVCIDRDSSIAGFNELVEAVHEHDAKIAIQLFHAGRQARLTATAGEVAVAPSEARRMGPDGSYSVNARALSVPEIEQLIDLFADGAQRAKKAGFDAVQIHGAHGYLIAQFMSPLTNSRNDEYGGDFERRMRFPLEILKKVRGRVGEDYPLFFRISGNEFVEGGLTVKDASRIAKVMQDSGIDMMDVSAALYESVWWMVQPMGIPRGCLVPIAEEIKKSLRIPVMVSGRINDPVLAEEILRDGKSDIIGMGRPLIADPDLPAKALRGDLQGIRKCIACNGCVVRVDRDYRMRCDINPEVGRESRPRIRKSESRKKILIVGGGPGGMEAARVCSLTGHEVVLYEKQKELGGQLNLMKVIPYKEEVLNLSAYLRSELKRLGVDAHLGTGVTAALIRKARADLVILATGAVLAKPPIPGREGKNVFYAWDVLDGKVHPKGEIVLIGGGATGCGVAEALSSRGCKVQIIEQLPEIGRDIEPYNRVMTFKKLDELGVKRHAAVKATEISDKGVSVERNGVKEFIRADAVVLATGVAPEARLYEELRPTGIPVVRVGDCKKPRGLKEAIHEGFEAAVNI